MKQNQITLIIIFLILLINDTSYSQSSIKVGKIEVMDFDSGKMSWDEANNKVKEKGNGWRLPNKEELFYLYKNKNLITGFSDKVFSYYWTSEKFAENKIWVLDITNGFETTDKKEVLNYIRLIKGKVQKLDQTIVENKEIINESKVKKFELDLSNLWDEYSGNAAAHTIAYINNRAIRTPEVANYFNISKNGNKIIWKQYSQNLNVIYDGIYTLTIEPSGYIVKLKCKFKERTSGKYPSTPGVTLIIDLPKASGVCIEDKVGKIDGATYNLTTEKARSNIREEQRLIRIKANEELQRERDKEKEDLILSQKLEKQRIYQNKINENNITKSNILKLNVGDSYGDKYRVIKKYDNDYMLISKYEKDNWQNMDFINKDLIELNNENIIGNNWKLPNLKEAELLINNSKKYKSLYSNVNECLIYDNGIYYVNHNNKILKREEVPNLLLFSYIPITYIGNLQIKKYNDSINVAMSKKDLDSIMKLSIGDYFNNSIIIDNSNLDKTFVVLDNCPVIFLNEIDNELKKLGNGWRLPNFDEAKMIKELSQQNKNVKRSFTFGGFEVEILNELYSFHFKTYYGQPEELYKTDISLPNNRIRFCPVKSFY